MKTPHLIVLFVFLIASVGLQAQTEKKSVEGVSSAKALHIEVEDGFNGEGNDVTGPKMIVNSPENNQVYAVTLKIGNSKGLSLSTGVEISGLVDDASGVKSIRVECKAILPKELIEVNGQFKQKVSFPVGTHKVKIIAADNKSNVSEITRTIVVKKEVEKTLVRPNLYVLSIGISDFKNSIPKSRIENGEKGFADLKYAHKDAIALANEFKKQQGQLYDKVTKKVIINEKASRIGIWNGFDWLDRNTSQGDVAIISISSHAFKYKDKGYIMTHEGDLNSLPATAFSFNEVKLAIDNLNNKGCKTVMFIDACNSGNLVAEGSKGASAVDIEEAVKELNSQERGVLMLLSSTGTQQSWEKKEWQHGAFTFAILEAMQQGKGDVNGDYILSYDELQLYVKERVKIITDKKQHPIQGNFKQGIARFPVCVIRD